MCTTNYVYFRNRFEELILSVAFSILRVDSQVFIRLFLSLICQDKITDQCYDADVVIYSHINTGLKVIIFSVVFFGVLFFYRQGTYFVHIHSARFRDTHAHVRSSSSRNWREIVWHVGKKGLHTCYVTTTQLILQPFDGDTIHST